MVNEFDRLSKSQGLDSFAEDRPTGSAGNTYIEKVYATSNNLDPIEKLEQDWQYRGTSSRGAAFEYNGNIAYFDDSNYTLLDSTGSVVSQTGLQLGSSLEDASRIPGEDRVLLASANHNAFNSGRGVGIFDLATETYDGFVECQFTTTPRATVTDGSTIVIADNDEFEAFNFSGTQQWTKTASESPYGGTATYYGGKTFHSLSFGGMLALDISNGNTVWQDSTLDGDPLHASSGELYLNNTSDGNLVEVDPDSGAIQQTFAISNAISATKINNRLLVFNNTNNADGIRIFNYNTGELIFSGANEIDNGVTASSIISNLFIYDNAFYVHMAGVAFDDDGTLHRFRMVDGASEPQLYTGAGWVTL